MPVSLFQTQQSYRLHVSRTGEHVYRLDLLNLEAPLQICEIARERLRIARNVDKVLGLVSEHKVEEPLLASRTRRIGEDYVHVTLV